MNESLRSSKFEFRPSGQQMQRSEGYLLKALNECARWILEELYYKSLIEDASAIEEIRDMGEQIRQSLIEKVC